MPLPSRRASASTLRSPRRCGWSLLRPTPRWPRASWWAPQTPARHSPLPYLSSSPASPVSTSPSSPEGAPCHIPPTSHCGSASRLPGVVPVLIFLRENALFRQFDVMQTSQVDAAGCWREQGCWRGVVMGTLDPIVSRSAVCCKHGGTCWLVAMSPQTLGHATASSERCTETG